MGALRVVILVIEISVVLWEAACRFCLCTYDVSINAR